MKTIITYIYKFIKSKFYTFSIIGLFNVIFYIVLHYIFLEILKINIYISFAIVFVLNVGISYLLNSYFTYKEVLSINKAVKFYMTYFFNLVVGLLLIFLLKKLVVSYSDFIITLLTVPPRVVLSFLIVNFYVFKDKSVYHNL